MAIEFKTHVINLKTMDQDIKGHFVVGAGDANGRTLRIILTQEAAKQITKKTKIYLSWYHQQKDIRGLNVFKFVNKRPPTWERRYPQEMLYEGDILCTIKIVDDISVVQSTNFIVHVLKDPDDGSMLPANDDYNLFQETVMELSGIEEEAKQKLEEYNFSMSTAQQKFDDLLGSSSEQLEEITSNIQRSLDDAVQQVRDCIVMVKEWPEDE